MRINLRNAGFELGSISFWSEMVGGVFEIEAGEVHIGSYSGKITTTGLTKEGAILHGDYIEVEAGEVLGFGCWVKGVAGDTVKLGIGRRDADANTLGGEYIKDIVMSGAWERIDSQYIVGSEDVYLQLFVHFYSALGNAVCYLDGMNAATMSVNNSVIEAIQIAALVNKTVSGDTTADKYRMYGFSNYYAEIDVTSMTGTTPTCDVTVCEEDQYGNERVIGTFTQFNATTDQRVGITAPIGKGMYVKYVMGGTVTDCDFKVSVIGVR